MFVKLAVTKHTCLFISSTRVCPNPLLLIVISEKTATNSFSGVFLPPSGLISLQQSLIEKKNKLKFMMKLHFVFLPTKFELAALVHVSNFGGWQGRRTSHVPPSLPPPLIFKPKFKIFVTPTLLKIRFKISVPPPPPRKRTKSKLRCFNKLWWFVDLEWTFKPQFLVTHDNLFHQGESLC